MLSADNGRPDGALNGRRFECFSLAKNLAILTTAALNGTRMQAAFFSPLLF